MRMHPNTALILCLAFGTATADAAEFTVVEDDKTISIDTPQLQAAVKKTDYVTGIAAGSLLDKRSGFRDAGFGLDIVDWIMERGSDEAYRDQLPALWQNRL